MGRAARLFAALLAVSITCVLLVNGESIDDDIHALKVLEARGYVATPGSSLQNWICLFSTNMMGRSFKVVGFSSHHLRWAMFVLT
jgi:hypothetical protein